MGIKPAHFIGFPNPSGRALNQLLYLVLPVSIALWMKEQKGAAVAIPAGQDLLVPEMFSKLFYFLDLEQ